MNENFLERANELTRAGQPFAVASVVRAERPTSAKAGAKAIVTADGSIEGWVGGSCAQPTVMREALQALRDGQPRLLRLCPPEARGLGPQEGVVEVSLTCVSGGTLEVYVEPYLPALHLLILSHLPVGRALAHLAKGLGYTVTVMGIGVGPAQFPAADRVIEGLDFAQLRGSPAPYVVVASHGNYDEEALLAALETGSPYIGLVASRRRAASVMQYLRDSGVAEERLSRVKFPAGLDLGGVTPEEIALSILAEIVQRRRSETFDVERADVEPLPVEALDPVCGMTVEVATARYTAHLDGQTFYFCSAGCKHRFEREPSEFIERVG